MDLFAALTSIGTNGRWYESAFLLFMAAIVYAERIEEAFANSIPTWSWLSAATVKLISTLGIVFWWLLVAGFGGRTPWWFAMLAIAGAFVVRGIRRAILHLFGFDR